MAVGRVTLAACLLSLLLVVVVQVDSAAHERFLPSFNEKSSFSDSFSNLDDWGSNSKNGSTQNACPQKKSTWLGYVFTAIAVFLFGTCYLATKQVDTGDGMFYQWVFCSAVIASGMVINLVKKWPPFQPLAMIGGATFATGNITVVPIVKTIGVGMGMLVWGMVNLIVGWASARYGILGVEAEPPCSSVLNYIGILFCFLALLMFLFVKSEGKKTNSAAPDDEHKPLLNTAMNIQQQGGESGRFPQAVDSSWTDSLSPNMKRVFGYGLAVFAGMNYGVTFNPVTHLQQHNTANVTDSTAGLDYALSHFSGIYLTSTIYFVAYAFYTRSMPRLYPKAVLPGLLSGFMWSIACSSWFVANDLLSQAIAFPIMTCGPAIIASFFGILVYKEISGKKNLGFFALAFIFTLIGVTLSGLSKKYAT